MPSVDAGWIRIFYVLKCKEIEEEKKGREIRENVFSSGGQIRQKSLSSFLPTYCKKVGFVLNA